MLVQVTRMFIVTRMVAAKFSAALAFDGVLTKRRASCACCFANDAAWSLRAQERNHTNHTACHQFIRLQWRLANSCDKTVTDEQVGKGLIQMQELKRWQSEQAEWDS